jgi:hypothetical protein
MRMYLIIYYALVKYIGLFLRFILLLILKGSLYNKKVIYFCPFVGI